MANKYRGEVAFSPMGEGAFISFDLDSLAELEGIYGDAFFGAIEAKVGIANPQAVVAILAIGLKARDGDTIRKIGRDEIIAAIEDWKFAYKDASKPIMDAVSLAWMHKSYDDLLADAEKRSKEADAANLKRAKEAAEEAGIPFDEALSSGLFKLLTALASAPSTSGN